jgi:hypothetical protein
MAFYSCAGWVLPVLRINILLFKTTIEVILDLGNLWEAEKAITSKLPSHSLEVT